MTSPENRVRRVLMTADTVGGVWTYAMELCRGLARDSVEVILATMGAPLRPDQRETIASLTNVTLRESSFALEWMENPWEDVASAGEWLWGLEREFEPDIVHVNGYVHGNLPWSAPVVVVAHSCVLSWWKAVRGSDAPEEWSRYAEAVRRGLQSATKVVAPTHWMAEQARTHYDLSEPVAVIPNGANAKRFSIGYPKENMVVSVGRVWDEGKNIRALAAVAPQLPWKVYVAGETRSPNGEAHPVGGIRTLGYLSANETAEWLGRAKIFALPARYEPFGLSVLEAALAGCALVLGDIPSLRELWNDAAVFVEPNDEPGLKTACLGLIEDAERREELAQRARARGKQLTAERMTDAYARLYQHLFETRKIAF
ncbi:MAG: glycosyltransferase family 4 protein [Nibricoccus sp.]